MLKIILKQCFKGTQPSKALLTSPISPTRGTINFTKALSAQILWTPTTPQWGSMFKTTESTIVPRKTFFSLRGTLLTKQLRLRISTKIRNSILRITLTIRTLTVASGIEMCFWQEMHQTTKTHSIALNRATYLRILFPKARYKTWQKRLQNTVLSISAKVWQIRQVWSTKIIPQAKETYFQGLSKLHTTVWSLIVRFRITWLISQGILLTNRWLLGICIRIANMCIITQLWRILAILHLTETLIPHKMRLFDRGL